MIEIEIPQKYLDIEFGGYNEYFSGRVKREVKKALRPLGLERVMVARTIFVLVRDLQALGYAVKTTQKGVRIGKQTRSQNGLILNEEDPEYAVGPGDSSYGISKSEAEQLYRKALKARAKGKRWTDNLFHWNVEINQFGDLAVGCVLVGWPDIKAFAKKMGWK